MNKSLQAEARLAQLKGYTDIYHAAFNPDALVGTLRNDQGEGRCCILPAWTRDWAACGPLMTECEIELEYEPDHVEAWVYLGDWGSERFTEKYADHPSRDQATRHVVVLAAIAYLQTMQKGAA